MVSLRVPNLPNIALLSVAGAEPSGSSAPVGTVRPDVAGAALIEYQIAALARAGICKFLIEVENVDGTLIALADGGRGKNLTIDFVRTGADMQRYVTADDRIWVQSGQLYVQSGLIETLLKTSDNFIATIDGRDENAAFERIDLNTRWAGVSIVGADTIAMLKDLPDDWSIISSLLRQALLAKVPFRPMSQQHVNNGTLTVLTGLQDFTELNRQILRRRVASRSGFLEAQLFGPILARIVPPIWQSPPAIVVTRFASPVLAVAAAGLAFGGYVTGASVAAFAAIAANSLRLAVTDDADGGDRVQLLSVITWATIISAMFFAAYTHASNQNHGYFAAFAVAALAFLTQRTQLPGWAKQLLHSPALLAVLAALGSIFLDIAVVLQWIMTFQFAILLFVAVRDGKTGKKTKQA